MNKSKRRKKTMRKLKHKKRTLRGGSMNTNQITKKANALRSTAIEKLNPFIDAITKLNGDTKMKLKKYIENMDIQPDILHLEENDKALFHFFI